MDTKTNKALQTLEEFRAGHPDLSKTRKVDGYVYPANEAINYATEHGLRWMHIEDTQRGQKRFGGETRKYWNIGINGSNAPYKFSLRPGWHAGSLPTMRQIGKGPNRDLRDDKFVWVKGEVSADIDYNEEAQRNPDKDIPDRIPKDGFYLKATNANKKASQADKVGWYVAGAFRPDHVISDAEARKVIDDWNAEHNDNVLYDFSREGGKEFTDEDAARVNRANGVDFSKREEGALDVRTMSDEEKRMRGERLSQAKVVDVEKGLIRKTDGKSARQLAVDWWRENVGESHSYQTEAGTVYIDEKSVGDSLAHGYNQAKLDAITSLKDGFNNAVYLGTLPDFTRQEGVSNHYFAYPINYDGKRSYVFCRAMQDNNKNRLYVHEVFVADNIQSEGNTLQTAAFQPHGGIALYKSILSDVLSAANIPNPSETAKASEEKVSEGIDRSKREDCDAVSHNERVIRDVLVDGLNGKNRIPTRLDAKLGQRVLDWMNGKGVKARRRITAALRTLTSSTTDTWVRVKVCRPTAGERMW